MSEQQPLLPPSFSVDPESGISGEVEHAEDQEEKKSRFARWRERTAELLESKPWHYALILLVLTDSGCVLADLAYTVLSDDCTPVEGPEAPVWLNVLSQISLTITTLFLAEIPVTFWAMGTQFYNPWGDVAHAGLHLFDSLIILVTFILEVVLRGRERELAGLLIILRLWRLVKLVGGIAVSAGEMEEENAKELIEVRRKLTETSAALERAQEENQRLRERITWIDRTDQ